MNGFNLWQFLAGIAVFVYAMSLIEASLKSLAGRPFKKFLQKQSQSKVKMMAASTVVTAFLQSSSVVLMMVLSFVGAGLINLRGALAAVLGSNLGTTLDSWVIALIGFKINFSAVSYPVLAIALIGLFLFRKKSALYHVTSFLIGFAFIFIALEWLKTSADSSLENSLGNFTGWHYLAFIPIGFLVTAVIQSSSVVIAITLAGLYNQLIPFESACAVVIGSELGTTLKFLLGSVGGLPDKKRVAWGNFILNLITMVIATILLRPLIYLIVNVIGIDDKLTGLVLFQSGINLFSIILFYPLLGVFAGYLGRFFKEPAADQLTLYIRKGIVALPGEELELAEKETIHLMNETIGLNKNFLGIQGEKKAGWLSTFREYAVNASAGDEVYRRIKMLQGEILEYITEIPKDDMKEKEVEQTGKLMNITRHILRSAKNLKDIRHNVEEYKDTANDSLFGIFSKMQDRATEFYLEFQSLIKEPDKVNADMLQTLSSRNRSQYERAIADMLLGLKDKEIGELDSSTLLNVYHEIYSSNKALISALADLKDLETED